MFRTTLSLLLISALVGMLSGSMAFAAGDLTGTVKLRWDQNDEADIAGYRVHYGLESGTYTEIIDVGYQVTAQISDLPVGTTYYCAVTAYNTYGLESDYSNEITFTVKPPPEFRDSDADGLSDLFESTYGAGADLDPSADPDGDGIVTIIEFVHGTDPTQRNTDPPVVLEPILVNGVPYLSVRYRIDPLAEYFITLYPEFSTDCSNPSGWQQVQTVLVASVPASDSGLIEMTLRTLNPISAQPRQFLRFGYRLNDLSGPESQGSP